MAPGACGVVASLSIPFGVCSSFGIAGIIGMNPSYWNSMKIMKKMNSSLRRRTKSLIS